MSKWLFLFCTCIFTLLLLSLYDPVPELYGLDTAWNR